MRVRLLALFSLMIGCQDKFVERKLNWDAELSASRQEAPQLSINDGLFTETSFKLKNHEIKFYSQMLNGVRVSGSLVKVLAQTQGQPILINGSYMKEIETNYYNTEDAKKNLPRAYSLLMRSSPQFQKTKLLESEVVYSRLGRQMILMNLFLVEDQEGKIWQVKTYPSGSFISMVKVGSNFETRQAQVYPRGPKQSEMTRVQLFDLNLGKALVSQLLQVSSEANRQAISPEDLLSLSPKDERFDQVQVFYFSQQALRWISEKFGVKPNSVIDIEVHVGAPEKTNIAFYYNSKIRFGSGDGENYFKIPQDPSIVVHETFHAVIDQLCRLPFQGEGGSLNEGFADSLTVLYLDQPHLGGVAYLKGPYKRTADNQSRFSDRNGGLYHDSLIISGLLWELRNKIGHEKTLALTYNLLLKMGPASTFEDLKRNVHSEIKKVFSKNEVEVAEQILKERSW